MNVRDHNCPNAVTCPHCAQDFQPIYTRLVAFFVLECVIAFLIVLF